MPRKIDPRTAARKILNSPRARVDHVVRCHEGRVDTVARIVWALPKDGAGPLRVAVYDWGTDGETFTGPQVGAAFGYGYDKAAAALCGLTVGGEVLGDHCDHHNRPTLSALCAARGWRLLSGTP
jgi:hypothetical protein